MVSDCALPRCATQPFHESKSNCVRHSVRDCERVVAPANCVDATPTLPALMDDSASSNDRSNVDGILRRDFLKVAGLGAGALLVGACASEGSERVVRGILPRKKSWGGSGAGHVVVVGAGAWGGWTALNLRRRGARVTLVDAYGAGNSRASSGDETRGVRSSYGDRASGELWSLWAHEAALRWAEFEDEHARDFGTKFFHKTGDIILRVAEEPFVTKTIEHWKTHGIAHEIMKVDDVQKRWPVFNVDDITVAVYETDAGVVRARYATQAVAAIAEREGVERVIGRVKPGKIVDGKMDGVVLDDGTVIRGDSYVFAVGPWLRKLFPEQFENRIRIPLGYVCYYGVPEGDNRFTYPNLPSWNFSGVTGWATLPVDNRGFRSRGSLARPTPAAGTAQGASGSSSTSSSSTSGSTQRSNTTPVDPAQQDPDTSVRWATPERIEGSRRFIERRFPLLANAPLVETRACHYDSSINRDFIIDNLPNTSNAWIAGAGQAEGFKFGPVVGEYIAQRVLGEAGEAKLVEAFRMPTEEYEVAPTT